MTVTYDRKPRSVYTPYSAKLVGIKPETPDITTFQIEMNDPYMDTFAFEPGNFVLISVFGCGEAPFAISSSPFVRDEFEISVKRMGRVTQAIHELRVKDTVGVRGPYGNTFLLTELRGKNLIFIGGGIGLAPLRSLIYYVMEERALYDEVLILAGAQTARDIPFREDFRAWGTSDNVDVVLTVDPGGESQNWRGRVGFVSTVLSELSPSPTNALAFICGPPIMIQLSADILVERGFSKQSILTTLENRMKCGIGKCGRCNIGHIYVCKHGPVFTYETVSAMPISDY